MKSVVRSGMNSRCVCVPCMKPLPVRPPEPIAIMPWMMWKPLPSGSLRGVEQRADAVLLVARAAAAT